MLVKIHCKFLALEIQNEYPLLLGTWMEWNPGEIIQTLLQKVCYQDFSVQYLPLT